MKIGQQECACLKFHYLGRQKTGNAGTWAPLSSPGPCQYSEKRKPISAGEIAGAVPPPNLLLVRHFFAGAELEAACLPAPCGASRDRMKEWVGFAVRRGPHEYHESLGEIQGPAAALGGVSGRQTTPHCKGLCFSVSLSHPSRSPLGALPSKPSAPRPSLGSDRGRK